MEVLAAVQHAVTDSAYLAYGRDRSRFLVHKGLEHEFDRLFMSGHILLFFESSAVRGLLGERASFHADAVAETFQEHGLVRDVDELIFEGGTPRIDDEYVHISLTLRIEAP